MEKIIIPAKIEDISIQWLEKTLNKNHEPIESLTYETVEGGYTGLNYRLFLTNKEGVINTVFVKFPIGNSYNTKSSDNKEHFLAVARKEIRFYQEIASECQIPIPQCLFSAFDNEKSLLILEDLGKNLLPYSRQDINESQIIQIADSMAAFHKKFWQNPRLESLDWINKLFGNKKDNNEKMRSFEKASQIFTNRFRSCLSKEQISIILNITTKYPGLVSVLESPPATLIHGDWTLSNLILRESDNKIYIVDWAGLYKGSYLWDMMKFLEFELDEKILNIFIESYSKRLNDGGVLVDIDDLFRNFYLAQAWYICGTIEFIAGIKEEYLHDPGTEWMWKFAKNEELFKHLENIV